MQKSRFTARLNIRILFTSKIVSKTTPTSKLFSISLAVSLAHGYPSSAAAVWPTWGSFLHYSAHSLHVIICSPTKLFTMIYNWAIYSWIRIWASLSEVFDWLLVPLIEILVRIKDHSQLPNNYIAPEVLLNGTANWNSFEVDTWPTGAILYTPVQVVGHPPSSSTCSCSYTRSSPCSFQTRRIRRRWLNSNDSLRCQGCRTNILRPSKPLF